MLADREQHPVPLSDAVTSGCAVDKHERFLALGKDNRLPVHRRTGHEHDAGPVGPGPPTAMRKLAERARDAAEHADAFGRHPDERPSATPSRLSHAHATDMIVAL